MVESCYGECPYVDCHYAECLKQPIYAESSYAACRYAECRGTLSWSLSCPTFHVNYVSGWEIALILFLSQMFVLWLVL